MHNLLALGEWPSLDDSKCDYIEWVEHMMDSVFETKSDPVLSRIGVGVRLELTRRWVAGMTNGVVNLRKYYG